MNSLDDAINELRRLDRKKVNKSHLPNEKELENVENILGIKFHPDFRKYLLTASNVDVPVLEPATIGDERKWTNIIKLANDAWNLMNIPRYLIPICEDNGDYYCMDKEGQIIYWSHNGKVDEKWPNLATWINEVWILRK